MFVPRSIYTPPAPEMDDTASAWTTLLALGLFCLAIVVVFG